MTPAALETMRRLAHPMEFLAEESNQWTASFRGTIEQAQQCELLRDVALPGEPGRPKRVLRCRLADDRFVQICRSARLGVTVTLHMTGDEAIAEREAEERRKDDATMLKVAAELDAKVQNAIEELKGWPETEEKFRTLAAQSMWRLWRVFRMEFLSSHSRHPSGFKYTEATAHVLEGHMHSVVWALEDDGDVTFDENVRFKKVRDLQRQACYADLPLRRFIEQVKTTTSVQEGGAP